MSDPVAPGRRALTEAIRDLPGGLRAHPAGPADVADAVAVMRAVDLAGCGRSEANEAEVAEELGGPDTRWGEGACVLRRGAAAVAVLLTYDGLVEGRGWDLDAFVDPADVEYGRLGAALVAGGLAEGRARWAALAARPGHVELPAEAPIARSFCFANDARMRAELEAQGFREVRRYWRMRIDHGARPAHDPLPEGYALGVAAPGEPTQRAIHAVSNAAFAEHFDSTPLPFERWRAFMTGPTSDPEQWTVATHAGRVVGFAIGSNRYAPLAQGYVASLAVLAEHRGRGLARALLRARFDDDLSRGFTATALHCDSENTTGATRVYEAVGMRVDQELVVFHQPLLG